MKTRNRRATRAARGARHRVLRGGLAARLAGGRDPRLPRNPRRRPSHRAARPAGGQLPRRGRRLLHPRRPSTPPIPATGSSSAPEHTGRPGRPRPGGSSPALESTNLTVCNFLSGSHGNGNEVWFNGGDGSGTIGMGSFRGAYLTTSSTFFDPASPYMAQYGIFASNSRGPGVIEHSYASNMADSSIHVGPVATATPWSATSTPRTARLATRGSNSGGHLVIEDSEWNDNRSGIFPNSLASDDPPPSQDGSCPDQPGK